MFNNSHIDFNSFCEVIYDPQHPETYYTRYILSFVPFSNDSDPYQVFAHEVGHALQVTLTHTTERIPKSFVNLNKFLDVNLEINSVESTDVFADAFTCAFMKNTPYEGNNELIRCLPERLITIFEAYFSKLIEFAHKNRVILKEKPLDLIL